MYSLEPKKNPLVQKIRKLKKRYITKMRMAETPQEKAVFVSKIEVLNVLLKP